MTETPHIRPGDVTIADTVLMPGDPLRAQYIAENYLEDAQCFNTVRNMLGYTGTYQGHKISVMGSGMGIPSISLYAYELIHTFGVKRLIRVGSCGALNENLPLYDIIMAQAASTDSNFVSQYNLPGSFAPIADFELLHRAYKVALQKSITPHVGNVLSTDVFYNADDSYNDRWAQMGILAVEMETAGLYATAAEAGVQALGIFTVSDNLVTNEHATAEQRQTSFTEMMEIALQAATAE